MRYEHPTIVDFGPIDRNTFDNPGRGDKDWRSCAPDPMWGEPSCPDGTS